MSEGTMVPLKAAEVKKEGDCAATLYFDHPLNAKPGQFVMLWLPKVGQKPMSVSYQDEKRFGLTIFPVGPFSKAAVSLKKGAPAGILGPYGSHFRLPKSGPIAVVGGGCGSAPVAFLAEEALANGMGVFFLEGARDRSRLLFLDRMKKAGAEVMASTDDGSMGRRGVATDLLEELLQKEKISKVFTCGPEIMMKKVVEATDNAGVPCEISMERYMKCGFGICGQCAVDELGIRICKEGPVLSKEIAKKIKEFGAYRRDATGKKVHL